MDSQMRKTFSLLPILLIIIVLLVFLFYSQAVLGIPARSVKHMRLIQIYPMMMVFILGYRIFSDAGQRYRCFNHCRARLFAGDLPFRKNAASEFDKTFTVQMSDAGIKFLQNEWITHGWCKLAKVPEEGDDEHFYLIGKATGKLDTYMYSL